MDKVVEEEQTGYFPNWATDHSHLPIMDELRAMHQKSQLVWTDYIWHHPNGSEFQIPTKEFVESIADYVVGVVDKLGREDIKILDVGAGNGRLSHFLEDAIVARVAGNISYRPIDNFSWEGQASGNGSPYWFPKHFPVEEISLEDAIGDNPNIIISSWMPHREDWTPIFRNCSSVDMFLMIGAEYKCGTPESWKADDNFERFSVPVEGNVSFDDVNHPDIGRTSVYGFLRR